MSPETAAQSQVRVMQETLARAEATYWRRRAETFEWTKPRAGDYHGKRTREQLSAAWRRAHESAEACRRRAELCDAESWREEVEHELGAVA